MLYSLTYKREGRPRGKILEIIGLENWNWKDEGYTHKGWSELRRSCFIEFHYIVLWTILCWTMWYILCTMDVLIYLGSYRHPIFKCGKVIRFSIKKKKKRKQASKLAFKPSKCLLELHCHSSGNGNLRSDLGHICHRLALQMSP